MGGDGSRRAGLIAAATERLSAGTIETLSPQRYRIARLHAKVRDARQELLHHTRRKLVNEHGFIGVETLSVKGMQRGLKRIRGQVANAALGELRRQLEYKAAWANRKVVPVDRFFPSSQFCSDCGWQNKDLKLNDRRWRCAECGAEHDRDINAAKNILAEALRIAGLDAGYREEPIASAGLTGCGGSLKMRPPGRA